MSLRVLLVEADAVEREVALAALHEIAAPPGPVYVCCAHDCDQARRDLAAGDIDAIILDYDLPDGTGLEFLCELHDREHPPVIMMHGESDVRTAVEILRAGAYDYIAKTGAWGTALAMTVARVMERAGLERDLADSRRQLAHYAAELEGKVAARTALVRAQAAKIEERCLKIEESARLKSETIAKVSHALRTPLNSILGYTDLLHEELPAENVEDARTMLAGVRTNADRLREVVESLLALGHMGSGPETVVPSRFTLAGLLEELRAEAQLLSGDRDLRFEWTAWPTGAEAETDGEKGGVIAYHLLSNAIKFTHSGRIRIGLEIATTGTLVLEVSDTGIGLPAGIRALIFDDVRRLDGASTHPYEAVGLGLGIVKRYTALLRGSLRVESVPGQGTTVTVELPPFTAAASDDERVAPRLGPPSH